MLRKIGTLHLLLSVLILLSFTLSPSSAQVMNNRDRVVKVMTRNLDAGSDFKYVIQAAYDPNMTQLELLMAISNTFGEMVASNIPARAQSMAREIGAYQPDFVGLQEVTTLRTGPYGQPAATVVVDGLQCLMAALKTQGLHYKAIAVQTNAVVDLPGFDASATLVTYGFTDYDVVLVRTDLPVSQLQIFNVAMNHFKIVLPFTVAGQSIPFQRGWISIRAQIRGMLYQFVTTHLETFNSDIQAAQTEELLAGPLQSALPVILAGDLNSDAYQPSWANGPAIQILLSAGFHDVWNEVHPQDPGLTWPLVAEDPAGAATPYQRIDLILTNGLGVRNKSIARTGLAPAAGVWSSDHAGVFGQFVILPRD